MAYFIHNKYDKASIDALATLDTTANTVVDYYGDYETYKYLDTSAGFGILYDTLSYVTPGTVIHDGQSDKDNSHFNFQSSIIVKSVQRGLVELPTDDSELVIPISPIDPSKAFVNLNGGNRHYYTTSDSDAMQSIPPVLTVLDVNSITLKQAFKPSGKTTYAGKTSYQIIELR